MKLSDEVEAATGADRELDALIALALGWTVHAGDNWIGPHGEIAVPAFSASIDAALTLISDSTFLHLSRFSDTEAEVHVYPNRNVGDDYKGEAATPALALCAAALRARGL